MIKLICPVSTPVLSVPHDQGRSIILDNGSLERLVPDQARRNEATGAETLEQHIARYEFAANYVRPGRLLDIACGVGYGTRLLVDHTQGAIAAIGVDISEQAIAYAKQRYGSDRTQFIVADATRFQDLEGFTTIVSLETIEHLMYPEEFISHLITLLRPNGVFIGSVPTTPSVDANPYHLHDFTEKSFRRMVERHDLKEVACFRQVQRYRPMPLLTRQELRGRRLRRNLPVYYLAHPGSLGRRIWSTLRHGFANHYITIVWQSGT